MANAQGIAAAPELLDTLRKVEWTYDAHGIDFCPWCGGEKRHGHAAGCQLAAVLAKADWKPDSEIVDDRNTIEASEDQRSDEARDNAADWPHPLDEALDALEDRAVQDALTQEANESQADGFYGRSLMEDGIAEDRASNERASKALDNLFEQGLAQDSGLLKAFEDEHDGGDEDEPR